jgi:large subunit ribosomal protein L6
MTIRIQENILTIENFIGERQARTAKILPNVKIQIDGEDIIVEGPDIDTVSQTAANIQQATKIRNKDLRKFLDGIYVYSRE